MFFLNFKYTLKNLLRDKPLIFWTFAFPIILGTLFSLAFSDIEKNETLDVFSIALVETEEKESTGILEDAFTTLSKGEDKLFDMEIVSLEKAETMLEQKEIVGYVLLSETPKIMVTKNGIEETVLKTVTETIVEELSITKTMMQEKITEGMADIYFDGNVERLVSEAQKEVEELLKKNEFSIKDTSPKNLSYTMIEFYTLIAMTCLYGGMLSMTSVNKNLANMSASGKRIAMTPTKKGTVILSSVLASFLVQLVGLALLFFYTVFLLKVDYGNKFFFLFLLSLVGSIAGVSLGCAVATLAKANENTKIGLLIAITMACSFFSGMMGITMKYIIDKNIPILNSINPANLITDGFYALYYYETNTKFYVDLASLLLFSGVLILFSMNILRRQKYDSI